jgi:hypothetical protein
MAHSLRVSVTQPPWPLPIGNLDAISEGSPPDALFAADEAARVALMFA